MDTEQYIKDIKEKKIDISQKTKDSIQKAKDINAEYNYLSVISEDLALSSAESLKENPKGKLAGLFVTVKDCIALKDIETRSSSRILSGYRPVFDATVIENIKKEGAIILGKAIQDEFGFGSFATNTGLDVPIPKNPLDPERVAGGSSGGCAGFTKKADFCHVSIAESTGGSIAAPASFCGVAGLTPTYGLISRYGLLDYANSMDKIGLMAKKVKDCAKVLSVIAGHDPKDSTSYKGEKQDYEKDLDKPLEGKKIGLIAETIEDGVDDNIISALNKTVEILEDQGATVKKVSLKTTAEYGLTSYYIIAVSEASTNLAKYCGMRYGKHEELEGGFNEYFSKVRSQHFGEEAKRRIILGTFARMAGFRDAYYLKALKVRTKIINEYKDLFKEYDALISPTMPVLPPKFKKIDELTPLQNYMMDIMTCGPNLAGFPHLSINAGTVGGLPVGIMLTTDHFSESKLLNIGHQLELNLNE